MRIYLFALLLSTFSFAACGQSKSVLKNFQNAKNQLRENQPEKAVNTLDKILKKDPSFAQGWILRGDIFFHAGDYRNAISSYQSALQTGKANYVLFNLGESYFLNGDYERAEKAMNNYLELGRTAERAREKAHQIIANSRFAKKAILDPQPFNPVNLGEGINDAGHQYFPSISADNSTLVFTERQVEGDRLDEDFFQSIRDTQGLWTPKRRLQGRLNTPLNEGAQSLSADGNTLYFAGCSRIDGFGSCDIYISEKAPSGDWSQPRNLGENINSSAWESMPCISPDGKTLYFVRGKDSRSSVMTIMYSEKKSDGSWSSAQPIPGKVNTPYRETTPFVYFDNQHLFFASDGHPGFGDLDFFVSKRNPDGTWGEPKNLGYPINSAGEESSLVISPDGITGYFASDRPEGFGGLDLYSFDLPPTVQRSSVAFVRGIIRDAQTKKPIVQSTLEVVSLLSGDTVWNLQSDVNGGFFIILPARQNYALSADKTGYMFHSENFALEEESASTPKELIIDLQPLQANASLILKNIFFDYDSYELKTESTTELNRLLRLLNDNPTMSIKIIGHTDNQGTTTYNDRLSANRAESVKNFLIARGISTKRLTSVGQGSRNPIADNDTEQGRALNRRIEVVVQNN